MWEKEIEKAEMKRYDLLVSIDIKMCWLSCLWLSIGAVTQFFFCIAFYDFHHASMCCLLDDERLTFPAVYSLGPPFPSLEVWEQCSFIHFGKSVLTLCFRTLYIEYDFHTLRWRALRYRNLRYVVGSRQKPTWRSLFNCSNGLESRHLMTAWLADCFKQHVSSLQTDICLQILLQNALDSYSTSCGWAAEILINLSIDYFWVSRLVV